MVAFLRLAGITCLLLSLALWWQHGAHPGLWKTSVETFVETPIIEGMPEYGTQRQLIWTDKFESGVETPLIGFVVCLFLFVFSIFLKRRLNKKTN